VKPYPAQGAIQTAILAAAEIAAEIGDLGQIAAIALDTTDFTYRSAARDKEKWAPETKETADHSLPYVVARCMLDGKITLKSFSHDAIHAPKARALMAKMTAKPDPTVLPKFFMARLAAGVSTALSCDVGACVTEEASTSPPVAACPSALPPFGLEELAVPLMVCPVDSVPSS